MHFFLTGAGFELYGPEHDDASQVNFNTPEVIEGLKLFQSMKEYLPVPYADLTWETVHGEFIKGNVPYIISGPWSIGEIKTDADFEWGVITIPTINGVQSEILYRSVWEGLATPADAVTKSLDDYNTAL